METRPSNTSESLLLMRFDSGLESRLCAVCHFQPYEFMPCAHHVDPGASGYPACPDSEYPTPECLSECSDTSFNGGTYAEDKKKAKEAYSLAVSWAFLESWP